MEHKPYNVFLVDRQRLIRSHANQLKKRAADPIRTVDSTPLSVFVDEFGLSCPTPVHHPNPGPHPGNPAVAATAEPDSGDSEYFSESGSKEAAAPPSNVNNRPRRTTRLPARHEPYYLS